MSKQLFPEKAQSIPESLALRYRILRDPAAASEFVKVLARIDRSVHRFQHPSGWNGERESSSDNDHFPIADAEKRSLHKGSLKITTKEPKRRKEGMKEKYERP